MNLPFSRPGPVPEDPSSAFDARPIVAIRRRDHSAWWFAGGALIAASFLFMALEARRQGNDQAEAERDRAMLMSPQTVPELVVPSLPVEPSPLADGAGWPQLGYATAERPRLSVPPAPRPSNPQPYSQPQPGYSPPFEPSLPPPSLPGSAYPQPPADVDGAQAGPSQRAASGRVTAGRLENPATTVIQGTLINAVLETALDSTRPGQARAVVTRDVFGFDGAKLLVPRGSRLYGNYEADVAQGQNRAHIQWTRLFRPDGVSIALDSPVADPLGRAGVKGRVNSHFIQRLGNTVL